MAKPETNLRVLKPSRKKIRPGDVFAMELPDGTYLFGRVINASVIAGDFSGAILIYIYRKRSRSKQPPPPSDLTPDELLVSPIMTNRLPWSRGYFETVEYRPLEPGEVLLQHCFLSPVWGTYFDEQGNELPGPVEPVGDYALHSYRTIADEISKAFGLELAPD